MITRIVALALVVLAGCSAAELPAGWTSHNWQGKTYYHNRQTGASQWDRPGGSATITTEIPGPARSSLQSAPPEIERVRAELARIIAERDAALQSKQQSMDLHSQLESRLNTTLQARTTLQTRLDESSQENRQLQLRLTDTREQLVVAQQKTTQLSESVATLRRMVKDSEVNMTVVESHLDQAIGRIEQQERELAESYKDIEKMDRRLRDLTRNRARSALPSFVPRAIQRLLPFKRNRPFKTTALVDEIETRLNRTIKNLRQNNTALAHALQSKNRAVEELTARAAEADTKAAQSTKAHSALREQMDLVIAKLAERDKQNADYESTVASLQAEIRGMQANQAKQVQSEQEIQVKQTTLSHKHQELQHNYNELHETLLAKDRMIEALNSTATSLQHSLLNLRHQLATTSAELAQLQQKHATAANRKRSRWRSWCSLGLI